MRVTNDEFRRHDSIFKMACQLADVQPTKRQASKYQRGIGRAYGKKAEAIHRLNGKAVSQ